MVKILISESYIGSHTIENFKVFPFSTVPINVIKNGDRYELKTDLSNNKTFKSIVEIAKSEECIVYLGYDLDYQGEAMARIVKNNLIEAGVKSKIVRLAFYNDKYIFVPDTLNIQPFLKSRYLEQEFLKFQRREKNIKKNNMPLTSLLKILCVQEIENNKGQEFQVNAGSNTYSYITRFLEND